MNRRIISIDAGACNGCGLCADACHEGAIGMVDGKAVLQREDYCDGLGDCLPVCPTGAISFEEREAPAFQAPQPLPCGCPGANAKAIARPSVLLQPVAHAPAAASQLGQWPVQIKLAPVNAPYFDGARLLIAADCAAYAHADFHDRFIKGHITLIGCPKLDEGDYAEKLTAILSQNNIRSVTVVRMEVPCCGGIENAVVRAMQSCGKMIPWQVVTLSVAGEVLD